MHIADRVHVDQESDTRDYQQHDCCERVYSKPDVEGEGLSSNPFIKRFVKGSATALKTGKGDD